VAIGFSVVLLLVVLELARRRRLVEEYSLLWIAVGVGLIVASIWRGAWQAAARWVGLAGLSPVAAMAVAAAACAAGLWISVAMSRQRQQIERLTEETAILSAELRHLRAFDKR